MAEGCRVGEHGGSAASLAAGPRCEEDQVIECPVGAGLDQPGAHVLADADVAQVAGPSPLAGSAPMPHDCRASADGGAIMTTDQAVAPVVVACTGAKEG